MNKKLSLLIVSVLCVLFSYAQCKSDLEQINVKGPVKQIKSTGIEIKEGVEEPSHIKISEFDKSGKELGYTFASKYDDMQPTKTTYEFNDKGLKVEEKRYNLKGKVNATLKYQYDEKGNMIEEVYYMYGAMDSYSYYKYNENCDRTEYQVFSSDSSVWLWYTYKYEDGLLTEVYDKVRLGTSKYKHDKNGNAIEYRDYDKDGNEVELRTYEYKYDKRGNWTKKTLFKDDEATWIDKQEITYW